MSEPKGAIPKLFVFITMLILGILFNVPDEVNIGVISIDYISKNLTLFGSGQAEQIVANTATNSIIVLKILGVVLFVVGARKSMFYFEENSILMNKL